MKAIVVFREIEGEITLKKQRAVARALLLELTGKRIKHTKTGRPIIDQTKDVSISHKGPLVCVAIVPSPYQIGVDVEEIRTSINVELFLRSVIAEKEKILLEEFCRKNKFALSSGVAIFWSVKEAFFKCLDYDLKPRKISISNITKNNNVEFQFSEEIKSAMQARCLGMHFSDVTFDEKYVHSKVVMFKKII